MHPPGILAADLRAYARAVGFDLVGITTAGPFPTAHAAMSDRLDRGYFEGSDWFGRERIWASTHPGERHPWARSVVALGLAYAPATPRDGDRPTCVPSRAIVARYARGVDYHRLMRQRLRGVAAWLDEHGGPAARSQWSFDAGWLADRAVARRAGLGVYGDNSCIVVPGFGSWVLLGAVITSVDLPADQPAVGRCEQCGACLSACPTGALVAPGVVDASRCVSYLTLELAGTIPPRMRTAIGNRLVGCDTCQDVCPNNSGARLASVPDLLTPLGIGASPDAAELLALSAADFDRRFKGTVVWRLGRERMARNAAVVLGNAGGEGAVAALTEALGDPSTMVREHAAWALRRLGGSAAGDSAGAAHPQPVNP